jgi:hypothetical protein
MGLHSQVLHTAGAEVDGADSHSSIRTMGMLLCICINIKMLIVSKGKCMAIHLLIDKIVTHHLVIRDNTTNPIRIITKISTGPRRQTTCNKVFRTLHIAVDINLSVAINSLLIKIVDSPDLLLQHRAIPHPIAGEEDISAIYNGLLQVHDVVDTIKG